MIHLEITRDLPSVNTDFTTAMQEVSELMFLSVNENFNAGGRPDTWQALRSGQASHLRRTRGLQSALYKASGKNFAEVGLPSSIVYAAIHHFGSVIAHPGS